MSKETRTDKFRNYRESAREGEEVDVEVTDNDDDFLSFMKKDEEEEEELHPLSYDTLKNDEAVTSALKSMKAKNDYDTKMDILNRLKADATQEQVDLQQFNTQDFSTGHDVHGETAPIEEVKAEKGPIKPEVKKEEKPLNEVDDSAFEKKAIDLTEKQPTVLSKKEIKALKKQEKTARKATEEAAKQALKAEKEAQKAKAAKASKETVKRPSKAPAASSKKSVISHILDVIVIILMIVVMIFIAYTIKSII